MAEPSIFSLHGFYRYVSNFISSTKPVQMILWFYALAILVWDAVHFMWYLNFQIVSAFFGLFLPKRMKALEGEIAIIVGSSRGVGRELAIQLADLGVIPICLDKNQADNKALVRFLRDKRQTAYGYTCDVTNQQQVQRTIDFIDREVGDISMYFHCCGLPSPRNLVEEPPAIQDTMNVSITSHFYLLNEIVPKMKRCDHGHIVLFTSVAGLSGIKTQMPLAVSQFAVQGLFESLIEDLRNSHYHDVIQCSLIHIYPFIISEDLENDIRLRIPSFFGTLRADKAAREIIKGVRLNQVEMSIPKYYFYICHILRMFPKQATFLLRELLDTGVDFG